MSWLDAKAAAKYAGYHTDGVVTPDDLRRFYAFAAKHLPRYHAGRALRVKAEDIDAALTDDGDPIVERALKLAASGGKR